MQTLKELLIKMQFLANEALYAYRSKDGKKYGRLLDGIDLLEKKLKNLKEK